MTEHTTLEQIAQSIVDCDSALAVQTTREALEEGLDAQVVLNGGLMAGADRVGKLFEEGEYFLPELMLAGKALNAAMQVIRPALMARNDGGEANRMGRVVIATVQTDIHDIGKSLVASLLTASGFELFDMGVDVPIKSIINKAEEVQADIIALSALLTTSMPFMRDTIELLKARSLREKYFVIVGGAPVTQEWAAQIGADGTAPNAAEAVRLSRRLLQERLAQES